MANQWKYILKFALAQWESKAPLSKYATMAKAKTKMEEFSAKFNRPWKELQLDCQCFGRTRIINLPTNQKGYDTFETTVGKLSARRIQIFPGYFCLGIILKVIVNNFQNNA